MPERINLHERDLDFVWRHNPIAAAVRRAALHMKIDEITMLRAVVIAMHISAQEAKEALLIATEKARVYDLMTEGIKLADGNRYIMSPPKSGQEK